MNAKENWNRQHKSCIVVRKNGQVEFDRVLKDNEEVKIVNKKQVEAKKRKSKSKNDIQAHIQENEGSYVHLIYKYGYPLMDKLQTECEGSKSNIHIIRFIQLATYSTFGGKLFDEDRNRIKKSSLSKIWNTTNRVSINETYNILLKCGYIKEEVKVVNNRPNKYFKREIKGAKEEVYIMISKELIVKGAVEDFKKLHNKDVDLTYTRLFTQNIQDMYESTDAKSRKQLANLFKILPFINFTHNVLCMNPEEPDHTKLEILNWSDVARICGVDENKNLTRFKNELFKLKIYKKSVVGQFTSGDSKHNYKICINPKVYYSGNNIEDLKALYRLFEM